MNSRFRTAVGTGVRLIRTAANYAYFRWHTRHSPPTGFLLEVFKSLNYSRASIRFMEDASKSTIGEGVYAAAGLLLEGPIKANGVILDVGAYNGEWAAQMRSRHDAFVHVFEPNPQLVDVLRRQFADDPKVEVHPFGLAGRNSTSCMSIAGMGSSVYSDSPAALMGGTHVDIELRDVKEVFDELNLQEIAMLKVNIEGGEYDLLDRLFACGLQARCDRIRVQFHEWYPDARRLRKRIVRDLARTHEPEWSYPFVWESWRRLDPHRGSR